MLYDLQKHMKQYVSTIIQKMKEEKLFAPQGGPIILAQVWFFNIIFLPSLLIFFLVLSIIYNNILTISFYLCNVDWEWVQPYPTCLWSGWRWLCPMGCKNGSFTRYWSSMDHVQAKGCSWSSGMEMIMSIKFSRRGCMLANIGVLIVTPLFLISLIYTSLGRLMHAMEDIVVILSQAQTW